MSESKKTYWQFVAYYRGKIILAVCCHIVAALITYGTFSDYKSRNSDWPIIIYIIIMAALNFGPYIAFYDEWKKTNEQIDKINENAQP